LLLPRGAGVVSATRIEGLPVWFCFPGSPAERAGVRVGDRLLIVNGVVMSNMDSFIEARNRDRARMSVTLQRGNDIHDLEFDFANGSSAAAPSDDSGALS
jgi:C-terminal processing protease CtpA/Prc